MHYFLNSYIFDQQMFGSVPIYDVQTSCTRLSYTPSCKTKISRTGKNHGKPCWACKTSQPSRSGQSRRSPVEFNWLLTTECGFKPISGGRPSEQSSAPLTTVVVVNRKFFNINNATWMKMANMEAYTIKLFIFKLSLVYNSLPTFHSHLFLWKFLSSHKSDTKLKLIYSILGTVTSLSKISSSPPQHHHR